MSIKLQVKNELRLVPIRFERATSGAPDADNPDVDDRGHNHKIPTINGLAESTEIRGAAIGVGQNKEVSVKLVREDIDNNAVLYLTSSDKTVMSVVKPLEGTQCPQGQSCKIKLKGESFAGSVPKSADLEVRFGETDGPIIAKLHVCVFPTLLVSIQPIVVTVDDSTGSGGAAPAIDFSKVMQQVSAIWAPCAVEFDVKASSAFTIKLANANKVMLTDLNKVIAKKWQANTINVYIVEQLERFFGLGISRAAHTSVGLTHPCVFLGMKDDITDSAGNVVGKDDRSGDTYHCANDVAHELGHFFSLMHPSDASGAAAGTWERFDTWSMRFLMHNYNTTHRGLPPQGSTEWPDFNDFGYGDKSGDPYRGALLGLKNVRSSASAVTETHTASARNYIARGPSVFY